MTDVRVLVRFVVVLGAALAACVFLTARAGATPVACPSVSAPATLPTAELNSAYTYVVPGCGDSWSITGNLPAGLIFTSSTHTISGTPTGSVSTASLRVKATSKSSHVTEDVELPVAETVQVDAAKGELTGVTHDPSSKGLVYVAGSAAGKVFDIDPSHPQSTGTAMSGLSFPAAVTTGVNFFGFGGGLLYTAQFGSPAAIGEPLAVATTPPDTSSPSSLQSPIPDGDTTCSKPDATAALSSLPLPVFAYSCAGSDQVTIDLLGPGCGTSPVPLCSLDDTLGPNGVPSGMTFDSGLDLLVADARNNTVTAISGTGPGVVVDLPAHSTPANVAYDANKNILYVADPGTDQISMVKVGTDSHSHTTLTDSGEIDLPSGCRPFGVAVNDSGTSVVATCSGTGTAQVIDVSHSKPTIAYSPQVGLLPDGVTIVGDKAFVANEQGGTVTVVDPPTDAQALHAQVAITHARRHGSHLVRRGHRTLRTILKQVKKASHGKRVTNLRALLKQIQREAKRHKHHTDKHHHRRGAAHTSAASIADPLVAPLSPFTR